MCVLCPRSPFRPRKLYRTSRGHEKRDFCFCFFFWLVINCFILARIFVSLVGNGYFTLNRAIFVSIIIKWYFNIGPPYIIDYFLFLLSLYTIILRLFSLSFLFCLFNLTNCKYMYMHHLRFFSLCLVIVLDLAWFASFSWCSSARFTFM